MRYAESLNKCLHKLFKENDKVFLLGEDISDPYGGAFKISKGLSTNYPDRVISTSISEAAIVGIGTGLALQGFLPVVEIMFGDFIALAADQVINSAAKFEMMYHGQVKVPLIIRTPMGGRRGYGPTHSQTIESIFFSIPGITMIAPSILHNPGDLLYSAVLKINGVKLFIENKISYPLNTIEGNNFDDILEINRDDSALFPTIKAGINGELSDILVIGYGGTVPIILDVAKNLFMEDEISIDALLPSIIKPLPINDLLKDIDKYKKIVIIEEGYLSFGWGAELLASIVEKIGNKDVIIKRIGTKDFIIPCSKPLEDQILPQEEDLKNIIRGLDD